LIQIRSAFVLIESYFNKPAHMQELSGGEAV